jgi:hypothetical protein
MTWIVAKSFLSGYVALLSDVQVTWKNGRLRKDCLKKVYPVAPNMVAGFSGSVDIGFLLLNDLANYIAHITDKDKFSMPRDVAHQWHRRARKIYSELPKHQQKLGCSIILAGSSPNERLGDSPFNRTDIIVFRNKNGFEPRIHPQMKTASIGSGSLFKAYVDFMDGADDLKNMVGFMNADSKLGGAGENFALLASIILQSNPKAGVSPHIHCTLVGTNAIYQRPLDFNSYVDDVKIEHKMPKVCETYNEFKDFQGKLLSGSGAGVA